MPARKKYNTLKRKLVPTSPIIARRTKQFISRELSENSEKSMPFSIANIQQNKDVYDQRVFESKSTLDSMINYIATNHNRMGRIKEEKNELKRQARGEQESFNLLDQNYKSLEADMDIRDKKITARIQREKDLKRIKLENSQQKAVQRKLNRDIFFYETDVKIPTTRKKEYVPRDYEKLEDELRKNQHQIDKDKDLLEQL
jgi:hypothetical protein